MCLLQKSQGLSYEAACANFWVLDAGGLITIKRPTPLSETVKPFARKTQEDVEGNTLVETVRQVSRVPLAHGILASKTLKPQKP